MSEKSPDSGQAGASKIEITPEMIEAGFYVLLDYDRDDAYSREAVEQVYRAMRKLELQPHQGCPGRC